MHLKFFTLFFSDGESKSLNHMLSMYERTFDLKTFFLGDGLSKQDGAYYNGNRYWIFKEYFLFWYYRNYIWVFLL